MNVCSNRNLISPSLKCLVVSVFHILDIIELTSFRSGLSSVFSLVIVLLITGTNVCLPLDVFMFLEMLSFMRLSFHLLILEVILLSLYHQNGSHLQNLFFSFHVIQCFSRPGQRLFLQTFSLLMILHASLTCLLPHLL